MALRPLRQAAMRTMQVGPRAVSTIGIIGLFIGLAVPTNTRPSLAYASSPQHSIVTLLAKLHDPRSNVSDAFGYSLAVSGDTVVVGAPYYKSDTGLAYIYEKSSSGWPADPTITLKDPDNTRGDNFGFDVAASATTVIVGAWGSVFDSGRGYIYVRGTSGWPADPTVTVDDPKATFTDEFGFAVALDGNTAVIGSNVGDTAYIYLKATSGWPTSPTTTLQDPRGRPSVGFGSSVALSGSTAVIGGAGNHAYLYSKGSSGWPTSPTVTLKDPGNSALGTFATSVTVSGVTVVIGKYAGHKVMGVAYIYAKGPSGWSSSPILTLHDPGATQGDSFGFEVGVSTTTAVIGTANVNSTPGVAYVYTKGSTGWSTSPTAALQDPNAADDGFGNSVVISGMTIAIAAPYGPSGGYVYIYKA